MIGRQGCGELLSAQVGQEVTLKGWVHRVRDHGGLVFFDLRDRTGLVQVVAAAGQPEVFAQAQRLRPEWVIELTGSVLRREPAFVNPRLATGDIEVRVERLTVLAESEPPPLLPSDETEVDETFRLRHRSLDLRRPAMQQNLMLRHRLSQGLRRFLDQEGFLEIETPMLTRSTPEGARDFLVPARVAPGSFYALPQSPQLFKQLLMISGLERYFQLARCFRDEDLRADRQPEFTQLDIEMAFVDAEDVMDLTERMLPAVFADVVDWRIQTPLPRLTYAEAMRRYGSDKPDLRFGYALQEVTDWAATTGIEWLQESAARGEHVMALAPPGALSRKEADGLIEAAKQAGAKGLSWIARDGDGGYRGSIARQLSEQQCEDLLSRADAKDAVLLCAGSEYEASVALGTLRLQLAKKHALVPEGAHAMLWVTEFPLLEWDEEEQRLSAVHHPFTSPLDEDIPWLSTEPLKARAKAYDVVLDGVELGGGSIRIHRRELQERMFGLLGLSPEEAKEKFGFLLDAFRYGAPPHGGIALGFDRMAMLLAGAASIRDVIAFPKAARGTCPLTEAPAPVSPRQLAEVGVRVIESR